LDSKYSNGPSKNSLYQPEVFLEKGSKQPQQSFFIAFKNFLVKVIFSKKEKIHFRKKKIPQGTSKHKKILCKAFLMRKSSKEKLFTSTLITLIHSSQTFDVWSSTLSS
jgi:hypothetical protein